MRKHLNGIHEIHSRCAKETKCRFCIVRSEKNTESNDLITLLIKLPNMNKSKVIFCSSIKYKISFKLMIISIF